MIDDFTYDGIGRASTKAVSLTQSDNLTTSYSYKPNGNETTPLVSGVSVAGSYNGTSLSLAYGYTYNPLDNITQETETENNTTTTRQYTYDLLSQLTGVTTTGGSPSTETFSYDNSGNLTEKVKTASGVTVTDTYGYDSNMTDVLTSFTRVTSEGGIDRQSGDGSMIDDFTYDGIGRASTKAVSLTQSDNLTTSYSYKPNGNETTPLVSGVSVAGSYNGTSLSLAYGYTYDPLDNITQETETENNTTTTRQYTYDLLSQLTGVTTTGGSPSTETFSYDNSGNLTEKVKTASGVTVTDTYGYDSNMTDVLTSFTRVTDNGGVANTEVREYNYTSGVYFNPTSIVYKDGNNVTLSTRTFTWREGRKLESVTIDGDTYTYYYDENGLRSQKTLPDGGKVRYIYNGGSLDTVILYASGNTVTCYLKYLYNASGELEYILRKKDNFSDPTKYDLFAVVYNGKGEITRLVQTRKQTSSGVGFQFRVAANYTYDAYGSVTVSSPVSGEDIGIVNPLRYKNYIYDAETDWYYLQTRYYDPAVGRFLNADGYADTGDSTISTNMFAYCGNNPVVYLDDTGFGRYAVVNKSQRHSNLRDPQNPNSPIYKHKQHQKKVEKAIRADLQKATTIDTYEDPNTNEKGYHYAVDLTKVSTGDLCFPSRGVANQVKKYIKDLAKQHDLPSTNKDIQNFAGELSLHAFGLAFRNMDNCKVADIVIYLDGRVEDGRQEVDIPSRVIGWLLYK